MCSIKHKEVKIIKRAYDINSVLYSTAVENLIVVTKQSNKMSVSNELVSKNFRMQIQISQQQVSDEEKKTHFVETDGKKTKNKNHENIEEIFSKSLKSNL